ncbi:ABC transporter permease [Aeromicrobium alkaliterrae]|uniref:ABC transporter permease n=1 Tax=Aeromicrobium alkaliterrae TaxID=302168 RepID=A0ABN2KFD2_9ACTN
MNAYQKVRAGLAMLWLPIAVLAAAWVATAAADSFYFPTPPVILEALIDGFRQDHLWDDLVFSVRNIGVAVLLGSAAAVCVGLIIGESRALTHATAPFLTFARATPMVAFIPIFIITFGIGAAPKIIVIAIGVFWPVLLNTITGIRGIHPAVRETAVSFRIPKLLYLRRIVLPGAAPQIFAGLRIAIAVALVLMVVSEIYGSSVGLGNYILESGARFQVAATWAGTVVIGALGYGLSSALILLERRVLGWHQERPRKNSRPKRRGSPAVSGVFASRRG